MTKRILIVDDDKDICKIVQISLEKFAGWTTAIAQSGQEGLLKAQTERLDAILLDVSMPDMDGFQFCTQIRANAATRSVPIILLTAKTLPSDRQRFAQMAVAGVITKPFNPMTVWTQVAKILGW
ncbi:response regulator [Gloeocapsopsis dulcis]|uniref:Two-component system response regulator n=1 Tax=Gloeocapsopsis dulcis AAB1 = 1H9 TaxID=1433147 RepID=A0A6N8G391_9CHRO|nr:response regulator [Gloeocapsopsis dulcis]MUL38975.1 two-component system response regulator [Gloeocapsopsis dulcis AAB1 = 1H9]WNN90247.1 response regulator [Gloeocapsopsis dulcis]